MTLHGKVLALCVLGAPAVASPSCWFLDLFQNYTTFQRYTNVSYIGPNGYGSGPAFVQMWQSKFGGGPTSMQDISDYLSTRGGDNAESGMEDAIDEFSSGHYEYYQPFTSCSNGKTCIQQGLGDIWNAALEFKPSGMYIFGGWGIVSEIGSSKTCVELFGVFRFGCQPSFD